MMREVFLAARASLRRLLFDHDSIAGRRFDIALQVVIFVSLAGLTIESLDGLPTLAYRLLLIIEVASIALFTLEYLLRVFAAPSALRYIFSFWGIVDFLAVFPYYFFNDSQWVRALRFLRIFRLLRRSRALARFTEAFMEARSELMVFGTTAFIMLFVAAAGIYQFEHKAQPEVFSSIPESLWWAVVTLTTVGYGDVYPITPLGRLFTGLVMIIGLGVVAGLTGVIASALTHVREEADDSEEEGKDKD